METHEKKTPMRDILLRAVAVLGLIAVLLLGAWGIIQLAVAIPNLFNTNGGGSSTTSQKESLTVSAAANLTSGQTLQVSWSHTNKNGSYSYTLSYACEDGLSVKAPLPTGSYQVVACNTPFNYVSATERMAVIPTATGGAPLTFTVSATKLSTGAVTAQGTATTEVAPAAVTTTTKTPAKTTTYTTSKNTSSSYYAAPAVKALYGYGDLSVSIGSVAPSASGLTAVTFTISNIGTNSIGAGWVFNASLPINGSYTFMSQPQRALRPGDKIVYTLTYSNSTGYTGGYNNGYNNGYGYQNGYGYTGAGSYTGAGYYTGTSYYSGVGTYNCNGYSVCSPPSVSYDPIDYPNGYPYYNNYGYNQGYNTGYNYGYSAGPVTITVDPQNAVWESNEYNNTATAY